MTNVNPEEYDEFSEKRQNPIDYVALGRRVKKLRKEQGIKQTELADALGISYQYMSMIETGKRKLSLGMLVSLANELGVTTEYLLNGYKSMGIEAGDQDEEFLSLWQSLNPSEKAFTISVARAAKDELRKSRKA